MYKATILFYNTCTDTSRLSNERERERQTSDYSFSKFYYCVFKRRKRQTLCILLRVMLSDVQSTACIYALPILISYPNVQQISCV